MQLCIAAAIQHVNTAVPTAEQRKTSTLIPVYIEFVNQMSCATRTKIPLRPFYRTKLEKLGGRGHFNIFRKALRGPNI